jgi:hypothetical protein
MIVKFKSGYIYNKFKNTFEPAAPTPKINTFLMLMFFLFQTIVYFQDEVKKKDRGISPPVFFKLYWDSS